MGALTSGALVTELQRRITNLSQPHALAALNRACRWITRQSSFQFMTQATTVLPVETQTAAQSAVTGTCSMLHDDSMVVWASGGIFETDGTWGPLVGPFPPTETGNPSKTITIGGDDFPIYWVQDTTHLVVLGTFQQAAGVYDFSVIVDTPSTSGGPTDMDPGKAKMILNIDGTPVQHVPLSDFWESFNYNLPEGASYNTYTIITDNTTSPPTHQFLFFPSIPGVVTLYYHRILTDLTGGSDRTAFPKDFDDLIVDLAEAEERRVYDVGDSWQLLLARCQDQIKVLLDGYRSMTMEPSSLQDSSTKIQEKTALGQA
jgi:hypothetical protein